MEKFETVVYDSPHSNYHKSKVKFEAKARFCNVQLMEKHFDHQLIPMHCFIAKRTIDTERGDLLICILPKQKSNFLLIRKSKLSQNNSPT